MLMIPSFSIEIYKTWLTEKAWNALSEKKHTPKPTKEQGDVIRYYKTENGTYYILKLQHDMHAGV